jgi:phage-related protein
MGPFVLRQLSQCARVDSNHHGEISPQGPQPDHELLEAQPLAVAKIDDAIEEYLNGRDPRHPPPEFPVTSQIEGELRELRVRFAKTRYRVLYQRSRNLMVLLHAFEKNTGAVTARDKRTAETRMADFEARMNASPPRRPHAAGRDAPPGSRGV